MLTKEFINNWLSQFNDSICWAKLHNAIINSKDIYEEYYYKCDWPTVKGDIFEYITKYILLQKGYEQVYLYKDIPISLKNNLGLPKRDEGIDIVAHLNDKWIGIQCKWRGNPSKTLNKSIVTQLIYDINNSNLDYGIIFTNVKNITPKFNHIDNIKWYTFQDLKKDCTYDLLQLIINNNKICVEKKKTVIEKEDRIYQQDAITALSECNNNRKKCIMACGTGKTHIMFQYIKNVINDKNRILMAFPSLQLINQVYKRLRKNIPNIKNILCICSQMDKESFTQGEATDSDADDIYNEFLAKDIKKIYTTNIDEINDRLQSNQILVLCTYQSSTLLMNQNFDLGLFDEAHKTVNNPKFGYLLSDDNCTIEERIFFTATPRYYKGKQDKCVSMNNIEIYGDEVFNYTFKQAIEDGYILDYNIIGYVTIPKLEDIVTEKYIKKDDLNANSNDVISAIQLAQHIKKETNDKYHILTYHNTVNNATNFKKTLNYIFNEYKIDADIFVMSGKTKLSTREQIFDEFRESKIGIICSARVLNEGVDIPCVNTVMFVDPRKSTIDVTQCIGRGMRLHGDNKSCDIIIPIHYDNINDEHNYSNIIEILTAMSEIDDNVIEYFINRKKSAKIQIVKMDSLMIDIEDQDKDYDVKYDVKDVIEGLKTKMLTRNQLSFEYKKRLLFEFCDINKRTPTQKEVYKGNRCGQWLQHQKNKIRSNKDELYIKLSQNKYVKESLDEYLDPELIWNKSKDLLFEFCDINKRTPQNKEVYKGNRCGQWLQDQKKKIRSNKDELYIKLSQNKYVKESLDKYLTNKSRG